MLIGLDQCLTCWLTLGAIYPDETLSSFAWRGWRDNRWYAPLKTFIDFLFSPIEDDHCYKAYLAEVMRKQLPKEFQ